jgi:hypothetical protein
MEQLHLAAEAAVVALLGLLEEGQVGLEVVAVLEGDAVDALQHRAVAVAAPIGAGDAHQLERVGGNLAGVLQMRAAAEVLPVAVPVHADRLIASGIADQLDLVGLVVGLVDTSPRGRGPRSRW